jgi:predicted dehydrogenase
MSTPTPASSRRDFLKTAAGAALALPTLVPRGVLGGNGGTSPSERIRLGLIGCGNMGTSNLNICARYPDVVVTAACDVDENRLIPVVERHQKSCRGFHDYRELLQHKDLDAVIVGTLPHWHALQTIAACEAGKDIYLQKPMTLHLAESLAVRNAVAKHGRICQIGTQHHATENHRRIVEYIGSGNLGKIGVVRAFNVMNQTSRGIGTGGYVPPHEGLDWDMWCGPARLGKYNRMLVRDAYHHCSWMDYSGGWTPGNGPHMVDLPIRACNLSYPTSVTASGGRFIVNDDGDAYDHHEVLWSYPGLTLTWMMSLTNSYGFDLHGEPKPHVRVGAYFHGENGTMYTDYLGNFKIVPEGDFLNGKEAPPKSIPPSPGHEREWLDCIKSRQQPSCNPAYHVKVDVPLILSVLALKLGRSIRFDPKTETIVGDREAARLAVPTYRAPWKFPEQYLS